MLPNTEAHNTTHAATAVHLSQAKVNISQSENFVHKLTLESKDNKPTWPLVNTFEAALMFMDN